MNTRTCFLVILSVTILLTACDKDDDNDKVTDEDGIVGSWVMAKTELKDCVDPDNNNILIYECDPGDDCRILKLKKDNTYESVLKSGTKTGTYQIDGDQLTACPSGKDCDEPISFVVDGNSLVTTSVGEIGRAHV